MLTYFPLGWWFKDNKRGGMHSKGSCRLSFSHIASQAGSRLPDALCCRWIVLEPLPTVPLVRREQAGAWWPHDHVGELARQRCRELRPRLPPSSSTLRSLSSSIFRPKSALPARGVPRSIESHRWLVAASALHSSGSGCSLIHAFR